ncbi:MAG TPA: hypothetical protein VG936_11090 [Lacunisphaera sp.]|nr:hypothetical protein [Lacunisphaera sp.]
MKLAIYGRAKKKASADGLLLLSEATFVASPRELRRVAAFLSKEADMIEQHGSKFGHDHLRDEPDLRQWSPSASGVIVANRILKKVPNRSPEPTAFGRGSS